jgi:hypothetical protein
MANSNFVVQNGLTVGSTTIFAGNGDVITSGNITVTGSGSFGGLSSNQIYQGASNVTVSGSFVNVSIGSTNVASFSATGLTVLGTTTTVQNEVVQGSLTPSSNVAYNLGSPSLYWSNGWIGQVTANTVAATTIGGTLNTAAQTNITSVGTLTGLTVSGATQTAAITSSGTIIAATINAATIGNASATLTGTLQTASQPNITTLAGVTSIGASGSTTLTGTLQTATQNSVTTMTGLTSLGSAGVTTTAAGNFTITGCLTVNGTTTTINNTTVETTEYVSTINATTVNGVTIGNSGAVLYGTLNSSSASQPNITTLAGVTSIGASGSTTLTGTLQTAAQTNITSVGTLTGLTVSGAIVPSANNSINIGSTSAWFNTLYGTSSHALYADLAENYQGDKSYMPGTVVMFGGDAEVTLAGADTQAVAGVVSTNPAHLMNGGLSGPSVVAVALQGRVPCMVIGPVAKGDIMVSAGFGYAKVNNTPIIGTIIGKALQDVTFNGKAVIEVVVGRT